MIKINADKLEIAALKLQNEKLKDTNERLSQRWQGVPNKDVFHKLVSTTEFRAITDSIPNKVHVYKEGECELVDIQIFSAEVTANGMVLFCFKRIDGVKGV